MKLSVFTVLWEGLFLLLLLLSHAVTSQMTPPDGAAANRKGLQLYKERKFEEAAKELWTAVLFHTQSPTYDVSNTFNTFLQCYMQLNRLGDGLAFVASESYQRGQIQMGKQYLDQALEVEPTNELALQVKARYVDKSSGATSPQTTLSSKQSQISSSNSHTTETDEFTGKTPEELYAIASDAFAAKDYGRCADVFELSCERSHRTLGPSCANAVYCRHNILDWGFNGTQFAKDIETIERIIREETAQHRTDLGNGQFHWKRTLSPHPHMMLAYPIDGVLKRYVAEATAAMDEPMARISLPEHAGATSLPPLPADLPFNVDDDRRRFAKVFSENPSERIRVGFVGSGFNSKAVLYLSQDMFRFFGPDFEIHVFSFGPADNERFIQFGMNGVDWRERVKSNVDYFHDCQEMKDHRDVARFVHGKDIHILIEWDGFARQGERAQGLFALRPAPIQMLHQEYLGTSGALYVDYLFTDKVASPRHLQDLYVEKLIYLPNHFFSKGHAYQEEVKEPRLEYLPAEKPHVKGTGSPQENRCLAPDGTGPENVSFVFCNFNKFLKNNPETVRSWIRILREVPDAILCLLENPQDGVPYLRKFIHEAAGTSENNDDEDTFVFGDDGDALIDRIFFLGWDPNPFDHQQRNFDFCNVMLDSHPYNGHTVAQDALYAGVPIVTRSDGDDMSSRVSTSANIVLDLTHLNAGDGPAEYEDIAIRLAKEKDLFAETRGRLIASTKKRNPMHPYWDVGRYVGNFETALRSVWENFLKGGPPNHIFVEETRETAKGTFDDKLRRHPTTGRRDRILGGS